MTHAPANRAAARNRMSRRELWSVLGASAAGWVMVFALVRVWWRVYLVVSQ